MAKSKRRVGTYTISVIAKQFDIHPQTLRLYEREGLLKPSRTEGNTRLYDDSDVERLDLILSLTRDLRVNLAGVEIILNMREKMEEMQRQMQEFVSYVNENMGAIPSEATDHLSTALVPLRPQTPLRAQRESRRGRSAKAAKETARS